MFWEIINNVGQKHFLWQGLKDMSFLKKKRKRSIDFFGKC